MNFRGLDDIRIRVFGGDRFQAGARYGRILDQAADGPVVETPAQVSGTIDVADRFDWNH